MITEQKKENSQIQNKARTEEFQTLKEEGYLPIEQIYKVAIDKTIINWKSFLYELINKEGLNPWDIDLKILTEKYLESLKNINNVDFDISGKFLTIAVYLLKTKTDRLIDYDLKGIEQKINELQNNLDEQDLEDFSELDDLNQETTKANKKKKYQIRCRNPLARKRKVTIFDLIQSLEKTFEQSNRRRRNFFQKKLLTEYQGPQYNLKRKDLKELIEEIFLEIEKEFKNSKSHIYFSHLIGKDKNKLNILEKFLPLLHLHNENRIKLSQEKHFADIKINKVK